jgi:hypothetical protein
LNLSPVHLVGCGALKASHPAAAAELYRGPLFVDARAYAEGEGGPWFILSARWGLVGPAVRLEPYEATMADHPTTGEQRAWASRVCGRLEAHGLAGSELVILAGRAYADPLTAFEPSWRWSQPLRGLGIGDRRRWLRIHTRRTAPLFEGVS